MDSVKDMLLLLISSSIVSNIVLSQFMGLCPFLGVSRKIKTAGGMGTAVLSVHSWRLPLRETLPETLRRLSTLPWLWRLWAEVCLH